MVPWPRTKRTENYYSNYDSTSTTDCTQATNYCDGDQFYNVYYTSTDAQCTEEVLIQQRITEYAVVWALIAYAVTLLRKLIEQRGRAPPIESIKHER